MRTFSIILPVRNGGDYVKLCVDSILQQTYPDFNLLVLDNNSNDGTLEWLRTLTDSRIQIFPSEASLTMEQNWGRIKDLPKNEFMTIIGHDDLFHKDYLEEMNLLISNYPDASLYQTHFDFIDENGRIIRKCKPMDETQFADGFLKSQIEHSLDSMGTGYLFRSIDYERLGGIPCDYPNLIFADYQLWIQLTSISYKATSPKTRFYYRIHNSISKTTKGEDYCIAFEKYIFFLNKLSVVDQQIKSVLEKYGSQLLFFYCESLSHRLLKTSIKYRKLKVGEFVRKCKDYALLIMPGQVFEPQKKIRILAAILMDSNPFTRSIFYSLKKR